MESSVPKGKQRPSQDNPSPEKDTSLPGREEEVVNQQDQTRITNTDHSETLNTLSDLPRGADQQGSEGEELYKEGMDPEGGNLRNDFQRGSDVRGNEDEEIAGGM